MKIVCERRINRLLPVSVYQWITHPFGHGVMRMKSEALRRTSGFDDMMKAARELSPARWLSAGLCLALGLGASVAIDRVMTPQNEPARLVAIGPDGAAASLPALQALDMARERLASSGMLKRIVSDLDLNGTGHFDAGATEEALRHAVDISVSDAPHIIRLAAKTGDESLDIVLAPAIANGLAREPAEPRHTASGDVEKDIKVGAGGFQAPDLRFVVVAEAAEASASAMIWVYQSEAIALGLLSALAILAAGLGRSLRNRAVRLDIPVQKPAVAQRGILEQIDMLERMWPETGRSAAMPEASNDEPAQHSLQPARQIVIRMRELRQEAQKAIEDPSEEAMENVLFDIQSLRDRILWIAGEQVRNRRFNASSR